MQEPFAGAPPGTREVTVPDRPPATNPAPPAAASAPVESGDADAATRPPPVESADAETDHAPPTWMQGTQARGLGKRALYGVIAGTFTLIGIAALVLQFATRPALRGTPAAPASAARSVAAPPIAAPAPTPTPTAPTAQAPRPSVANAAPPTQIATSAAHVEPHVAPQAATPPARPPAPTVALPRSTAPAVAPPIVVSSPAERKARCTEILQKASLEKITPPETDFFKRECK